MIKLSKLTFKNFLINKIDALAAAVSSGSVSKKKNVHIAPTYHSIYKIYLRSIHAESRGIDWRKVLRKWKAMCRNDDRGEVS